MNDDEPILLHEGDLMIALLESAAPGEDGFEAAERHLRHLLAEAGEEPERADWEEVRRRLKRCALQLLCAGALEAVTANRFRLTPRGRELLAGKTRGIDETVLMRFPEYRHFVETTGGLHAVEDPRHDAFIAGMQAFEAGVQLTDNPHPFDTVDHLAWENGWFAARDHRRGG